jgi:hypothetical protein
MKSCQRCDIEYSGQEVFCPTCGNRLETADISGINLESFQMPRKAAATVSTNLNRFFKPRIVLAAIGVLLLLLIWISNSQGQTQQNTQASLSAKFSPSQLSAAAGDCSKVANAVNSYNSKTSASLLKHIEAISDGRTANSALGTKWYASAVEMSAKYLEAVDAAAKPGLDKILPSTQQITWSERNSLAKQWNVYVLKKCGLSNDFKKNASTAASLKEAANGLSTLAASAPWYPDGYFVATEGVAWKWTTAGSCRYSSFGCWHMDVISQNGCPSGLYAAVNIVDSNGTVVGYTNDSLPGLGAMQKARLEFDNTTDYNQAQFQEIKCY